MLEQDYPTLGFPPLRHAESLEKFHASAVCEIHLRPFRTVMITLDDNARDIVLC